MKVVRRKLEIFMAKACMNPYDLCKAAEIQYQTYQRLMAGKSAKPATIGKIARALNASVEQIVEG